VCVCVCVWLMYVLVCVVNGQVRQVGFDDFVKAKSNLIRKLKDLRKADRKIRKARSAATKYIRDIPRRASSSLSIVADKLVVLWLFS
jgi:hypothetical protein